MVNKDEYKMYMTMMMPTMMMMMISYDKSAKPSCITFASNNHYVPRASVRCNDRPGEIAMR